MRCLKSRAELAGDLQLFAAHVTESNRGLPQSSAPALPRALWAYAVADVRIVAVQSNPQDGEGVVEVQGLPPAKAAEYLEVHADVLRHPTSWL